MVKEGIEREKRNLRHVFCLLAGSAARRLVVRFLLLL